ncbi:type VI secretion system ImpA family N-terminal domain-containing protein, partial [candidate division CSSED10-310 bacterium]
MELKDLGKTPISADKPAGENVQYDPLFESLSEEIQKLASPTASSAIDWNNVIRLSKEILETKSKDLLACLYLSVGLLKIEKLSGFEQSIVILKDLLETYWENMFPPKKRMKKRINAVNWWKEKIEESVPSLQAETWPSERRAEFLDNLNTVDQFLGDKSEDAP